jgi:hypothetical protein
MSDIPTGWKRWFWWLRSRKAQAGLATIIVLIAQDIFGLNLDPEVVWGVVVAAGVWIGAIALEDAAEKRNRKQ